MVQLQSGLKLDGRPVRPAQLHLTLAFLARVRSDRLEALSRIAAGLDFWPCTLELDILGCFPRARVAWLGSSRPPPALASFQAELVQALLGAGFEPDLKPWKPHVTLYRDLRKPCCRMPLEALNWRVSGFTLVRSELGAGGPVYHEIGSWPEPV